MLLTPTEMERLTIFTAAEIARRRKERGLKTEIIPNPLPTSPTKFLKVPERVVRLPI